MPEFSFQDIILLVGIYLLVILLTVAFILRKKRDLGTCFILFLGIVLIIVIVVEIVDPIKIYQCRYTIPDQIRLAGHIKHSSNSQPNDYLVILYRENEEIARFITRNGIFTADRKDEQKDGYFELTIPNEFKLTRCSMLTDFKQDSFGHDFLWLEEKTTYLWHNFADIEAGTYQPLNHEEPQKRYTLVVLPDTVDQFPKEISLYSTYLDQNGEVAINVPIKTYRVGENAAAENITSHFIHDSPLSNITPGISTPAGPEVWDAWVVDGSTYEINGPSHLEPIIIDRDNCLGSLPQKDSVPIRLIYIQEVQFEENASLNFDLGVAALKAAPSLGFTQGQMKTIVANIEVDVPAGAHKKYKVHWQDLWKTGSMSIDFGQNSTLVRFRARIGMDRITEFFPVECP